MSTGAAPPTPDFAALWRTALEYDRFVAEAKENREL